MVHDARQTRILYRGCCVRNPPVVRGRDVLGIEEVGVRGKRRVGCGGIRRRKV
jgi:hypothetical protein